MEYLALAFVLLLISVPLSIVLRRLIVNFSGFPSIRSIDKYYKSINFPKRLNLNPLEQLNGKSYSVEVIESSEVSFGSRKLIGLTEGEEYKYIVQKHIFRVGAFFMDIVKVSSSNYDYYIVSNTFYTKYFKRNEQIGYNYAGPLSTIRFLVKIIKSTPIILSSGKKLNLIGNLVAGRQDVFINQNNINNSRNFTIVFSEFKTREKLASVNVGDSLEVQLNISNIDEEIKEILLVSAFKVVADSASILLRRFY